MKLARYVVSILMLLTLAPWAGWAADLSDEDMPEEVRTDVQRIYPFGEKFDRKHIQDTCADPNASRFRCFKSTYDQIVEEREPTVTGYVLLLSIGTVVLAEERQKIIDSGHTEKETEGDLQRNTLDTAELLIETLEQVGKKAHVIEQEKPVAVNLRTTLLSRAESVLKQQPSGRSIASVSNVSTMNEKRRDALLKRLSSLSPK